MDRKQFMEQIGLPEKARSCVLKYMMPEYAYQNWRNIFYKNETRFFQEIEKSREKEFMLLYLYLRFAEDLYPAYKGAGIPDCVYYDTFSDLTVWSAHCFKKKCIIGLTEEKWLKLHLKMKLFRLGRLQFEKDTAEKSIHIHIPEGGTLSPKACGESIQQARGFFGDSYKLFDCESWLLSPVLLELLNAESNIIRFQKRFRVLRVNKNVRQAEERVFGEIRVDKQLYPENTALQKSLKRCLLNGRNPGVGYGILI